MFDKFAQAGAVLFSAGCNDSHSGNISVVSDESIVITAKNAMLGNLSKDQLITVPLEGDSYEAQASRDVPIHRVIYKSTGAKAIVHAHIPSAMALSVTENKILPQDAKGQAMFPQGVCIVKIRQGADRDEIARMTAQVVSASPSAVVIKGYGAYAYGATIDEALEIMTALEMSSKIWMLSKMIPARQLPQHQSSQSQGQGPSNRHHGNSSFGNKRRSAIPPGIGVMDRRTSSFSTRRDIKR